jgi:hypothetical protein
MLVDYSQHCAHVDCSVMYVMEIVYVTGMVKAIIFEESRWSLGAQTSLLINEYRGLGV